MGGSNSGRPRSRRYLSSLPRLSLVPARIWRQGATWGPCLYTWSNGNSMHAQKTASELIFRYSIDGQVKAEWIALGSLPRHFGGTLTIAYCPCCGRAVRVLYFASQFVCRRCTGAVYASKGRGRAMRAQVQFQKLRARIRPGTEDYDLNYMPRRPKGMRRATYERLRGRAIEKLNALDAALDVGLWRFVAKMAQAECRRAPPGRP